MTQSSAEEVQNIGKLGESIACRFLEEKSFKIIKRNYRKKWGEIDIIAETNKQEGNSLLAKISSFPYKITYFIEVKAIQSDLSVTHETEESDTKFNPLDNISPRKIERLKKAIDSYLSSTVTREMWETENFLADNELNWKFGVIALWMDLPNKKTKVKFIKDIAI